MGFLELKDYCSSHWKEVLQNVNGFLWCLFQLDVIKTFGIRVVQANEVNTLESGINVALRVLILIFFPITAPLIKGLCLLF